MVKHSKTGDPFLVLATQNPIEQEGTYPLPEAQTDRFMMKIKIDYPSREEEKKIVHRMSGITHHPQAEAVLTGQDIIDVRKIIDEIYVDDKVTEYILDIVFSTRNPQKYKVDIEGLLDYGASPRASLGLTDCGRAHAFMNGRGFVTPHDIKSVAPDVLRHRLRRSYEAEAQDILPDNIIETILTTIPVP